MKGYEPETFGDLNAETYDASLGTRMDAQTRESVEFLADLAAGGRVLELAVGTGRVAVPLAAKGLDVCGIEASDKMVAKMHAKPGGEGIPVTIGDMAEARMEGEFDLVFLVFNTIINLLTQEAQVRCFKNAARHMSPKGVFVVETFVPDLSVYRDGQAMKGHWVTKEAARFEIAMHDPVTQRVDHQRIVISEGETRMYPFPMRYVWPSELDLMAQVAGLELRDRYAWWDRSPFTAKSTAHVSVYGWAASPGERA